jgi:hypothetical protein
VSSLLKECVLEQTRGGGLTERAKLE